mmetsp:Transcript_13528/g.23390  ORF Transcript_13528/g.23390 Transcript_13528/m.23390 type:complete len:227 (+) Transcript_13528:397-1077(+)
MHLLFILPLDKKKQQVYEQQATTVQRDEAQRQATTLVAVAAVVAADATLRRQRQPPRPPCHACLPLRPTCRSRRCHRVTTAARRAASTFPQCRRTRTMSTTTMMMVALPSRAHPRVNLRAVATCRNQRWTSMRFPAHRTRAAARAATPPPPPPRSPPPTSLRRTKRSTASCFRLCLAAPLLPRLRWTVICFLQCPAAATVIAVLRPQPIVVWLLPLPLPHLRVLRR